MKEFAKIVKLNKDSVEFIACTAIALIVVLVCTVNFTQIKSDAIALTTLIVGFATISNLLTFAVIDLIKNVKKQENK